MALALCRDLAKPEIRSFVTEIDRINMVRLLDEPTTGKGNNELRVYASGRDELTDASELLFQFGELIAKRAIEITQKEVPMLDVRPCMIGLQHAGTPFAVAASRFDVSSRVMRVTPKRGHGLNECVWFDKKPSPYHRYFLVDNALNRGTSVREALPRLAEDGYLQDGLTVIVAIDRQQGGREILRSLNIETESIIDLPDLLLAFGLLGLWPDGKVREALDDLEACQLVW